MIYVIVYLILSMLYGFIVFRKHPARDRISVLTQAVFGTTIVFHVLHLIFGLVYKTLGINMYYAVTVNTEDE